MIYLSGSSRPQRLLLCSGAQHKIIFWLISPSVAPSLLRGSPLNHFLDSVYTPNKFYGILHSKQFGSEKWQLDLTFRSVMRWVPSCAMSVEKVLQRKLTCTFIKLTFDIWRHIWKCTVETSQIIAANVSMHPLMQVLWGHICKRTVEKSPTNATNVTLPLLVETFWGHIWQRTVEKNQTNATNVNNVKQFGESFENAQWRKVKQMQPM